MSMKSSAALTPLWLVFLYVAGACAQLEKERPPAVVTSGPNSVRAGETIQLAATTTEGTDDGYLWESADPAIATVDDTGLVRGVLPGETAIKVKGAQSGVEARHPVVVVENTSRLPYYLAWLSSPHADSAARAFNDWNEEGSVPLACARCHSSEGYVDYLGGDGTAAGRVDAPGKAQSVVRCETCHAPAASTLSSVTFPSGVTVTGLGEDARCMVCHQGRASGADVDLQIADAGVVGEDTTSPALGFTNIHYYPAAATLLAGRVRGGYQYGGSVYDTRSRHVPQFDQCNECHDPHSTAVRWDACASCHPGVSSVEKARDIRQIASRNQDYDGDGNRAEGIYFELDGLRDRLLAAMQRYGTERNRRLCYATSYPYWFNDTDGDGRCNLSETVATNRYGAWTPRLQKAAYNYQMSKVDPGNFAHNAKYVIELLYDSVQAMNAGLAVPFDTSGLVREDPGHFNGASPAARNWDRNEAVDASCSRCHGGSEGYRFFVEYGTGQTVPETANGLECATCHDSFAPTWDVLKPKATWLPDRTTADLPGNDDLCANCHIGRASKATIDQAISAGGPLKFINVHYLPGAGTREGSLVKLGYEYPGKTYAGRLTHTGGVQCTSCHDPVLSNHTFEVADVFDARCKTCHADASELEAVRTVHLADYDGDGDTEETLEEELEGMGDRLLMQMQSSTVNGLCYAEDTYPYFFKDTDGSGACETVEATATNAYSTFTPAMLKAAHNLQLSRKDPGAWAHNFDYVGQLLFDSVEDLTGAKPTNMIRP